MSNKIQPYGLDLSRFAEPPSQIEIELLYIANLNPQNFGGLDPILHRRNAIKILWPWVDKYWHNWNDLCLWAWCNYEEICASGCATSHKTFTFTLLAKLEWLAKPTHTGVILTSTTIGALRGRIWSEMKNFYDKSSIPFNYNVVDSLQKIQYKQGEDKFAIRGIATNSGEIEKTIGNLQGNHPERMVIIVDEAEQTPDAIFTARANLSSGTSFYRFVAIANPNDPYSAFGLFSEAKAGRSTITAESETWETKSGICLHFDGLKSPNVVLQQEYYPRLFAQKTIDKIRHDFGENSLEWWMYVRGFCPPSGVRDTILDASIIEEGKAREKAIWEGTRIRNYGSLDPAFTTGGDRCIIRSAKVGNFADSKLGIELQSPCHIQLVDSTTYPINYQIADKVAEFCKERDIDPENFSADSTSASGLMDILSQRWSSRFRKVSFGGAPTDGPISFDDKREAKKIYGNRVTQIWFGFARLVSAGRIRGLDMETAKEFCSRKYELKNEKTVAESKGEMKKRTGGISPDLADPAGLIVDHVLHQENTLLATRGDNSDDAWKQQIVKYKLKKNYAATH